MVAWQDSGLVRKTDIAQPVGDRKAPSDAAFRASARNI
jgi:hypothetical protein